MVPLDKNPITGLAVDQPGNKVIPLFRFDCDANPFFRWSGTEYEMYLFRVGEEAALYIDHEQSEVRSIRLYSECNADSKT